MVNGHGKWIHASCAQRLQDEPAPELVSFYWAYRAALRARLSLVHLLEGGQSGCSAARIHRNRNSAPCCREPSAASVIVANCHTSGPESLGLTIVTRPVHR
jgi:hypothetical protein